MSRNKIVHQTSTTIARQRATAREGIGRVAMAPTHSCWRGCGFTTCSYSTVLDHEATCEHDDPDGMW